MVRKSNTLNTNALDSAQLDTPALVTQCDWQQDEAFVSILCSSWQSQYAEYIGSKAADSLINQLRSTGEIYNHNVKGTLIATLNDQKVGIIAIRDLDKMFLITLLEVLPDHQRKGIASQMLNEICTVKKPVLVHVSVHRPWLRKLYEKHGFQSLAPEVIDHYGHLMTFDVMIKA